MVVIIVRKSWLPVLVQSELLKPHNRMVLAKLLGDANYQRVGKAGVLATTWRKWLRDIHNDGAGAFIDMDTLTALNTIVQSAQH